jgi:AraC-like DNA-binding protein
VYGPEILLRPREAATPEGSDCPRAAVPHHAVAFALRAIDRRYGDASLCLKQVAGEIQGSVWHVGRLLRRETGSGFTAHLRRRRVGAAQALLQESALSLKEIAGQCGFATPSQFSRQFAQAVGVTPSAFRLRGRALRAAPEMTSERACPPKTAAHNRS